MKETLSDKEQYFECWNVKGYQEVVSAIPSEDVKEFIRLLKKKMDTLYYVHGDSFRGRMIEEMDNLAGEKLK